MMIQDWISFIERLKVKVISKASDRAFKKSIYVVSSKDVVTY